MGSVAREQFVPPDSRPLAYTDRSLPIGGGRFLAAPEVLGQLLTQMAPRKGERALIVGAGTGYTAAVLAAVGCEVAALESSSGLVERALELGSTRSRSPQGRHKAAAPYDLIVIDARSSYSRGDRQATSRWRAARRGPCRGRDPRLIVGQKVAGAFGYLSTGRWGRRSAGLRSAPGFQVRKVSKVLRKLALGALRRR